jgi:lipoyl(octanoyl) transferase
VHPADHLTLRPLGLLRYADALRLMEEAHARIRETAAPGEGEILVVEHPPVVTMGNRFLPEDMILTQAELLARAIDFHKIDRGGSVTVHEPGQVVIYPLVKLDRVRLGAKAFVHALEEAMILLCAEYGFVAARDALNPGVWVGENKIGAIGIRILEGVTKHGLAFNVVNDLSTFASIVPCGLRGRGVTTLAQESKVRTFRPLDVTSVGERLGVLVRERILATASGHGS